MGFSWDPRQEAIMDSGLTIRPTANVAETAYARPEPTPVPAAVATTVAASKSVAATADSARSAGHDPAHNALLQHQQTTRSDVVIDSQTREVIFRVIDLQSGEVDHQVPDAALLRMRAYHRELAKGAEDQSHDEYLA
jgi:hypothetical protein